MSRRKFREPEIVYPPFEYEKYGLVKKELPYFIISPLDNLYASNEKKEDFFERFVYPYLIDENFRKEVDGQVLVFEGSKYIDHTYEDNIFNIGSPGKAKHLIDIGKPKIFGFMGGSKSITHTKQKVNIKTPTGEPYQFNMPNHYSVN